MSNITLEEQFNKLNVSDINDEFMKKVLAVSISRDRTEYEDIEFESDCIYDRVFNRLYDATCTKKTLIPGSTEIPYIAELEPLKSFMASVLEWQKKLNNQESKYDMLQSMIAIADIFITGDLDNTGKHYDISCIIQESLRNNISSGSLRGYLEKTHRTLFVNIVDKHILNIDTSYFEPLNLILVLTKKAYTWEKLSHKEQLSLICKMHQVSNINNNLESNIDVFNGIHSAIDSVVEKIKFYSTMGLELNDVLLSEIYSKSELTELSLPTL